MSERERRIAENEAVFRAVNDKLQRLNESFAALTGTVDIVCECGNLGCVERIVMEAAQYEHVRAHPRWFTIVEGHSLPGEHVVERQGRYEIVEKDAPEAIEVSEETYPR